MLRTQISQTSLHCADLVQMPVKLEIKASGDLNNDKLICAILPTGQPSDAASATISHACAHAGSAPKEATAENR